MIQSYLAGKKVLIMGLGRFGGGVDAARFAHACKGKVTVTDLLPKEKLLDSIAELDDLEGVDYRLGEHLAIDFTESDVVIFNPAVDPGNKFLQMAEESGAEITTAMNIFYKFCPARIIAITGSNGKSTTSALTYHLLKAGMGTDVSYDEVYLTGNIGHKPLLQLLFELSDEDIVVMEISSFQSELLEMVRKGPDVGVLTNLTPNHLDRHGTFEKYSKAKEVIFKYQPDDPQSPCVSVFNAEDEVGLEWYEKYRHKEGRKCFLFSADQVDPRIAENYKLPGKANLSNLAAALTVARLFNLESEILADAVKTFEPLPHRLEFVTEKKGVRYYNDSISTTPDSTMVALDAFDEPKVLIAGGYDKQLPLDELGKAISEKAKAVVLIGQTANKLYNHIVSHESKVKILLCNDMKEAVKRASEAADDGDVVLLSPGFASYDMFENFQERGRQFVELAEKI